MNIFKRTYRFVYRQYLIGSVLQLFPDWRNKETDQILNDYCSLITEEIAADEIDRLRHLIECHQTGATPAAWRRYPRPALYQSILGFQAATKSKQTLAVELAIESQKVTFLMTEIVGKDKIFESLTHTSERIADRALTLEEQFLATLPEKRQN
ncbi:hypothetical protein GCM10027347_61340 [Larkinella harenae]